MQTPTTSRSRWRAIFLAGLTVLLNFALVAILRAPAENKELPPLVLRIDDIQDYAFREGQFSLLNESAACGVAVSLSIIAGKFGQDKEIVQAVKGAVDAGSEVAAHGWNHEDLTAFSLEEQAALLARARARIQQIFDGDMKILVPPMFSFNEDTISAMQASGYTIISSFSNYTEPGLLSKAISIPGTVNLSDLSNNATWKMKDIDSIWVEVSVSVQKYGFAVIVTHPQEFLENGELIQAKKESYRALLDRLKEGYSFKTLEKLAEIPR